MEVDEVFLVEELVMDDAVIFVESMDIVGIV